MQILLSRILKRHITIGPIFMRRVSKKVFALPQSAPCAPWSPKPGVLRGTHGAPCTRGWIENQRTLSTRHLLQTIR
jgi:hypothetical protein